MVTARPTQRPKLDMSPKYDKNCPIAKGSKMRGRTTSAIVTITVQKIYLRVFSADTYIASIFFSSASSLADRMGSITGL